MERQVTHTVKSTVHRWETVDGLCGPWDDGEGLRGVTEQQAVYDIDNQIHNYYVQQPGMSRVEVETYWAHGAKHVRTTADQTSSNNLANLPNCYL